METHTYFTMNNILDSAAAIPPRRLLQLMVDAGLKVIGSDEQGTVRVGVRKVHSSANTIRIEAIKKAGTEKAKKIEEETILGAILEVSGLQTWTC